MGKETLKQMEINVAEKDANDVSQSLHEFLDMHNTMDATKKELAPLFSDVVTSPDIADKIETTVNKEHIKNLITAMQAEFSSDGSNYNDVYAKWGKSLVFGLQSALRILGYKIGTAEIDGRRGPDTIKAIKQFQKLQGLEVDGAAGYHTFTALMNVDFDTKISEEQSMIDPDVGAETNETDPFFAQNTSQDILIGEEKNRLYQALNYADIPSTIPEKTVVDWGKMRFFSNGVVMEYNDQRKIVRRGMRGTDVDSLGSRINKTPSASNMKETATKENNEITADDMTVEQLQINAQAIWKKYFTFETQRQQDLIKNKFHIENGVEIEQNKTHLIIRSPGSSYYYLTLDRAKYENSNGLLHTKDIIKDITSDIGGQMEMIYFTKLIDTHINNKYKPWDRIFTKAELEDKTSPRGKKIHDLIAYFEKGAVVVPKKRWSQIQLHRQGNNTYMNYTFETEKSAPWNTNECVVDIKTLLDNKGNFSQQKWTDALKMMLEKKLQHPYFAKYDPVRI